MRRVMRMYNSIAYLITEEIVPDEMLNQIPKFTESEVFVKKSSIGMREFYAAATADLKPSITLTLADPWDYDGQKLVRFEDVLYNVLRTHEYNGELNLTLEERIGSDESEY
jgi:hypothetical protein